VRKSNPLMKPGDDQQTPPATAKTMASVLIIVATPCPERLSRNHAPHRGRADAHDAAVHSIRATTRHLRYCARWNHTLAPLIGAEFQQRRRDSRTAALRQKSPKNGGYFKCQAEDCVTEAEEIEP
jgi:hypothetical protein